MGTLWFIALLITHGASYFLGRADGKDQGLSEEAYLQLEKYKYDKFYEHERWMEERKAGHE